MYGESVFTTLRALNGVPQDWGLHFDRLCKSADFLFGPFLESQEWGELLRQRIETKLFSLEGDKVVRLTLYREQSRGLLKAPVISVGELKLNFSTSVFDSSRFSDRLKLRTCPSISRPDWWPGYLKCGNYLNTILLQKRYLRPGDDDVLFLSPEDTVLESSVANIFVVKNDRLFTSPAGPNVLEGVMRQKVLSNGGKYFAEVSETETSFEQLLRADGVFGCNSVRGLFLVDRIDDNEIIFTQEFLDKFRKLSVQVLQ
jgi:4-amino-4-deoxychorismate lyase